MSYFVFYCYFLYVSCSGSIASVWEEGATSNLSAIAIVYL